MRDIRVLLYSCEQALVHAVQRAAKSHKCSIAIRPIVCSAETPDFDLVISHLSDRHDFAAAHAMLAASNGDGPKFAKSCLKHVCILDRQDHREEFALLKAGAAEVFTRPLDLNRLSYLLGSQAIDLEARRLRGRRHPPASPPAHAPVVGLPATLSLEALQSKAYEHGILFRSRQMLALMDHLRHVIRRDSTILLSGETGTGKTQLAHLIHTLSPRSRHPFVVANCAALTPSLLESELFGHARGAFTGASQSYDGKFHAAGAGTIFLDEIDSLPPSGQQRLLRVLDQRLFEKVGSNEPQTLHARVIAAANRPLERLVADGEFRSDLYYRLKVATADMPPLRDRPEDIPPIAMHMIAEEARREGESVPEVDDLLLEKLSQYNWPGNIRELRNVVSQMVMLSGGRPLTVGSMPRRLAAPCLLTSSPQDSIASDSSRAAAAAADLARVDAHDNAPLQVGMGSMRPLQLERARGEANRILHELERNNHNRTKTAQSLGISRAALHKKLKKLSSIGLL